MENLINFKKARDKARYIRRQAKRTSWSKYISEINSFLPSKEMWERIRQMKGDYRAFAIPLLGGNNENTDVTEQANIGGIGGKIGGHFAHVSSTESYTDKFCKVKERAVRVRLGYRRRENEPYNAPFTLLEFKAALYTCKPTAVGSDQIHYAMFQNLEAESLLILLSFFNIAWKSGCLPEGWKLAVVIPLLKQGKDPSNPASCRPISLTSCLCKTYERMVSRRLVYVLENKGVLDPYQCGFCNNRCTLGHLVRLEAQIRNAFVLNRFCVSIFFDL